MTRSLLTKLETLTRPIKIELEATLSSELKAMFSSDNESLFTNLPVEKCVSLVFIYILEINPVN